MVHRDLKPDNVLFDDAGHVLLSDFGLVKIFDKESATTSPAYDADLDKCPPGMTKTACGTLDYMSREMLFQKPYSHSVDYWALGVLMFFLLTGRKAFAHDWDDCNDITMAAICGKDIRFENTDYVDDVTSDLIHSLLIKDPAQRPTVSEMKAHAFFADMQGSLARVHLHFAYSPGAGLPMLTIWNMVDPPTNPTPIEGLGPDEAFCVLAPVCDSQIARPSSLFLRVLRYDEEQERLKSNPSKTKIQFCNKIQKWFGGIGGGAKAKARAGK
ncbi:kinase-like protein [Auriscalpium vulgare]|uniref:Kinase-like protein n=1 Tax=Auriscalpium vulgare TaxID=40419 RepID=A0ACB8RA39_9AGAM|nr:kinase-like protein [Auriscalpium vulgare]